MRQEQIAGIAKIGLWQAGIRCSLFWDISALGRSDDAKTFERYQKVKKRIEDCEFMIDIELHILLFMALCAIHGALRIVISFIYVEADLCRILWNLSRIPRFLKVGMNAE